MSPDAHLIDVQKLVCMLLHSLHVSSWSSIVHCRARWSRDMSTLSTRGVDVIQRRSHLAFGSRGLRASRVSPKAERERVVRVFSSRHLPCWLLLHRPRRSMSRVVSWLDSYLMTFYPCNLHTATFTYTSCTDNGLGMTRICFTGHPKCHNAI